MKIKNLMLASMLASAVVFAAPAAKTAAAEAKEAGDDDAAGYENGDDYKDGQRNGERINLVKYVQYCLHFYSLFKFWIIEKYSNCQINCTL